MRVRYTRVSTVDVEITEEMLNGMTPEGIAQTDIDSEHRDEMFDIGEVTEKFMYEIFDDENRVVLRGESDN